MLIPSQFLGHSTSTLRPGAAASPAGELAASDQVRLAGEPTRTLVARLGGGLATTVRAVYGVVRDTAIATTPALLTWGGALAGGPVGAALGALAGVGLYGGIAYLANQGHCDQKECTAEAAVGAAASAACGTLGPLGVLVTATLGAGRRMIPGYLGELADQGKLDASLPRYPWEQAGSR